MSVPIASYGASIVLRRRGIVVCVVVLLSVAGCLWRGYATILGVHLDVLTQTAAKLVNVVESGRGPTAEGMAEYVYPAQRAREFMRQFSSYGERASYRQLGVLLDRYEAIVKGVDAARVTGGQTKPDVTALAAERDKLEQLAVSIRIDAAAGQ